jgi:hypothetical protein
MERMTKMTTTTEYTGIERRKKGPLEKPLIFHVLDVGTRHMSKEDSDVLQRYVRNNEHPVYELAEYGWLIYATPVDGCWPGKELSDALKKVLSVANALGCDYVRFDRDGEIYPEFERFHW